MRPIIARVILLFLACTLAIPARAERIRIAQQYGAPYLALMVMQQAHLLEAEAERQGLAVEAEWVKFTSGVAINDALISGNLDIASGGITALLTIWARTQANLKVKAIAGLNNTPVWLNSIDPGIRTLKDYTETHRIALPAVKSSIQAVVLQMAAQREFGPGQFAKLDHLTVSLGHPDAMAALLSGNAQITSHLTQAPYMYLELADPRAHRVLDSYEVLGGPHTATVVWATQKFHDSQPRLFTAFLAALDRAVQLINADHAQTAALWLRAEPSGLSQQQAMDMLFRPENAWTIAPRRTMDFARFMQQTGAIPVAPARWQDLFFPELHGRDGS